MNILADTMARFADHYHARRDLVAEQRGWDCVVVLAATDAGERVTVRIEDGRIADIRRGEGPARLVIHADLQTLCDVLELRRGPNEPYLFGALTVRVPEADVVR